MLKNHTGVKFERKRTDLKKVIFSAIVHPKIFQCQSLTRPQLTSLTKQTKCYLSKTPTVTNWDKKLNWIFHVTGQNILLWYLVKFWHPNFKPLPRLHQHQIWNTFCKLTTFEIIFQSQTQYGISTLCYRLFLIQLRFEIFDIPSLTRTQVKV